MLLAMPGTLCSKGFLWLCDWNNQSCDVKSFANAQKDCILRKDDGKWDITDTMAFTLIRPIGWC